MTGTRCRTPPDRSVYLADRGRRTARRPPPPGVRVSKRGRARRPARATRCAIPVAGAAGPHASGRPPGVGEVPVEVALAGDVGALVTAAHRHHYAGPLRVLPGSSSTRDDDRRGRSPISRHRLDHLRMHPLSRRGSRRPRLRASLRLPRANSASLICDRPALCRHTNSTRITPPPGPAGGRGWAARHLKTSRTESSAPGTRLK